MLTQLTITNFGLIDTLSLECSSSLIVLTGETGAGKSIIIDALRYCLGERLSPSQIKKESLACTVEAIFELKSDFLKEHPSFLEYCSSDEKTLILSRSTLPDGRNKIKVNHASVTVSMLKELGDRLVDFHGPHDHQMLLSEESHLGLLDRLCTFGNTKKQYEELFTQYSELHTALSDLRTNARSRERDCDLLKHQIKELEQVPLYEEKYEEVMHEYNRLSNTEKLYETTSQLIELFENDITGLREQLGQAFSLMKALSHIDASLDPLLETLSSMEDMGNSVLAEIQNYRDSLSFEPEEAERITSQCDRYHDIKRKYGPTIEDARTFFEQAKQKYELLVNFEENEEALLDQIASLKEKLLSSSRDLSKERKKAAKALEKTIVTELQELGIKHVEFECRFIPVDFVLTGADHVVFFISPNRGEPLKPLADIVSSGEAARLMLALKKALIAVDPIPVLIFDEIDAQIGGRLGTITGKKLQELSRVRQVLLITHLPQIAAFGNTHYKVSKTIKNNHTTVTVTLLETQDRIEELAQMMSGEKETSVSLKHAEDMLHDAHTS